MTASESIDSMPPSAQRGNDMLSEACFNQHRKSKLASHVIPAGIGAQEGIYGRRGKEVETYCDGLRKHRFHAPPLPSAGMTCFLMPVPA